MIYIKSLLFAILFLIPLPQHCKCGRIDVSKEFYLNGGVAVAPIIHGEGEISAKKSYTLEPEVIGEHTVEGAPIVHKTIVSKTIIPQYVEKTIRVPTIEEHHVRVAVSPKVIEDSYTETSVPADKKVVHTGNGRHVGYHAYITKSPTFYNDIFNIPISTLGAVNNLLNGLFRGRAGAGVSVHKEVSANVNAQYSH